MRSRIRNTLTLISLLLFPVILNFLSPYVPIDGAMQGIVAGSLIFFFVLFLSGIVLGRLWCGWGCPVSALSDNCRKVNNRRVNIKKLKIIRLTIFSIWSTLIIVMFILAGGISKVDVFHLTENKVSVDEPWKYITYYMVLVILIVLNMTVGRRGACHSVCWMSPFMHAGAFVGRKA